MSVLASKTFAINIVEVDGGKPQASIDPKDDRIAHLERQIKEFKAWQASISTQIASLNRPLSPISLSDSTPNDSSSDSDIDVEISTSPLTAKEYLIPDTPKPSPKTEDHDVSSRIMTIIQNYGSNEKNAIGSAWLGRTKFEPRVRKHVDANLPIELVLPAFPWKSVNKVEKVLGAVPDLGEELALGRLNNLCDDIQEIYPPGAKVTITSDGLVYNDLLGISDEEVYEYGSALRRMAKEKDYQNISFIRIMNLLGMTNDANMTKEEYLSTVSEARKTLVDKYLDPNFDARDAILNDEDIKLTYCGYIVFLSKDLRHSPITAGITGKNAYKRVVKRVATDMIIRGKAFAAVIDAILPDYVRLSIHRSTGLNKLSFPLVPQPDHFSMTPWHCSIAVTSNGEFRTAHALEMRDKYDLIYQHGRPYYFRDRSEMWNWEGVEFEFFYPKGVVVKAVKPSADAPEPVLGREEFKKLAKLGTAFNTVITQGFAQGA